MRSLELFTGAGGLALGTHVAGFRHTAVVEWNEDACSTLRKNVKARAVPGIGEWDVRQEDIRKVDFRNFSAVELIAGGVPCQPFSLGGKHQGVNDSRDMFPDFVRAVGTLAPRAFIAENVKGLLRPAFRMYFGYIVLHLTYPMVTRKANETWPEHLKRLQKIDARGTYSDLKYRVVFQLVNAADYGVPQLRERVFVVGLRSDANLQWEFPKPTHSQAALLHDQWGTGDYWERHCMKAPRGTQPQLAFGGETAGPLKPWRTVRDAISDLPKPSALRDAEGVYNHRINPGARTYEGHTGSPLDRPAKTLKAGVHGVPGGENMMVMPNQSVRYFTVREAARLQTFPDKWKFEGAWSEAMRQLGNAVPMQLAAVVSRSVADALKRNP